ncbi:MAG: TIGR00725 family protein [Longimicrobiales bacterium]
MVEAVARPVRIAVCGAGDESIDTSGLAEEVGREIAHAGAVLVCGGLGGVMKAAARGAASAGGLTIGVLPGRHTSEANSWITLPLPTGMGEGRNILVVRFADAVIAIGGEWGTLSEVALARKIGVPVVLLAPTLAADLGLEEATTPAEAVRAALQAARPAASR